MVKVNSKSLFSVRCRKPILQLCVQSDPNILSFYVSLAFIQIVKFLHRN